MRTPGKLREDVTRVYMDLDGAAPIREYHDRHGTESLQILTVLDGHEAARIVKRLRARIYGKLVVEVGAGVGILACEMAAHARHVYAIEADPAWSWVFTKHLYERKPVNLTWIFGRAEDVADWLKADVAVIVTRSGHAAMQAAARRLAPVVIDVNS